MALLLVLLPLCFAALALATPSSRVRPWLVPAGGVAQLVLVDRRAPPSARRRIGRLAAARSARPGRARFHHCLSSCVLVYVPGYLALHPDRPNRIFCACCPGLHGR